MGRDRGFMVFLKAANPNVLTIHCVIDRQHLAAKNMSGLLNLYKAHTLNACFSNCAKRMMRPLSTCLSTSKKTAFQGKLFCTIYSLLDKVVEFLQSCDTGLAKEVTAVKNDIAYLSDIL